MQIISMAMAPASRLIGPEVLPPPHERQEQRVARLALCAFFALSSVLCTALSIYFAQPLWLAPAALFAICALWEYTWVPEDDSSSSGKVWSWPLFVSNGSSSSWSSGHSSWDSGDSWWTPSYSYSSRNRSSSYSRGSGSWGSLLSQNRPFSISGNNQLSGLSSGVQSVVSRVVDSVVSTADGRQVPGLDSSR